MINIYTTVIHGLKNHFSLTASQYFVLDTIDLLSQNGRWCYKSKINIARDLYISDRSVGLAIKKLIQDGLVEKKSDHSKHLRTTSTWREAKENFSKMISDDSSNMEEGENFSEDDNIKRRKNFSNSKQNFPENTKFFPENTKKFPTRKQEQNQIKKEEKEKSIDSLFKF